MNPIVALASTIMRENILFAFIVDALGDGILGKMLKVLRDI